MNCRGVVAALMCGYVIVLDTESVQEFLLDLLNPKCQNLFERDLASRFTSLHCVEMLCLLLVRVLSGDLAYYRVWQLDFRGLGFNALT